MKMLVCGTPLIFHAPGLKGPSRLQTAIFNVWLMIKKPNLDCKFIYGFLTLHWHPMPLGVGRGQNVRLRDFCHIWTLLPLGASVFHKHMSNFIWIFVCNFIDAIIPWRVTYQTSSPGLRDYTLVRTSGTSWAAWTLLSPGPAAVWMPVTVTTAAHAGFRCHRTTGSGRRLQRE